jgi:WD40 repeat protein
VAGQLLDQAPFGTDNGPVLAVAFSPDDAMVASAGQDGDVCLRDARTGEHLGQLVSDNETVWSMAFSPDGAALVIGDEDGSVRAWDPRRREERTPLADDIGLVLAVSFAPDGAVLAAGIEDGVLRLLDTRSTIRTAQVDGVGELLSAAFSRDGALLAAGGRDGSVRTWDTRTYDPRHSYDGHGHDVQAVAINPDGTLLAGGGLDGNAWLWDLRTGSEYWWLQVEVGAVQAMAFSPDGTLLAVAGTAGPVCLWDVSARAQRGALLTGHEGWVSSVAFSPDGTMLVTGAQDGTVRLWDVRTGQQRIRPRPGGGRALAFSHDGYTLAGVGEDGSVRLWAAPTMGDHVQPGGQDRLEASVAFSSDDTQLAVGGADGSLDVWDARTGERLVSWTSGFGPVQVVAFSKDGVPLALSMQNGTTRVWHVPSSEPLVRFTTEAGQGEAAAFSPDATALAIGFRDGTARLWEVLSDWEGTGPAMRTGQDLELVLEGHVGPVRSVAFSWDGTALATAGDDGTVRLWDVVTGQQRVLFTGHSGSVRSVAFSPDGGTVSSGGDDRLIRLWDVRTGQQRQALAGHTGTIRTVAFSPHGAILASGGEDALRIWNVHGEYEIGAFGFADPSGNRVVEEASAAATQATEEDLTMAEAFLGRAEVFRGTGDLEQALAAADQAIRLAPGSSAARLVKAGILGDLRRFDEALDLLDEVIAVEPANQDALTSRARILYDQGSTDEVLAGAADDGAAQVAATAAEALLGGGYDADDAGDPTRRDALGFTDDVRMLCSVLADRKALPPLSVGLFGEWGSGKSFFMRLMRQRIARLADVARDAEANQRETRYCSHVVQITFNAWHYMDANLWASLAAEIFFRLASPDSDATTEEKEEVDRQREAILNRLDTCQQLTAELTETRKQAETQRIQIEEQLDQARTDREGKAAELAKTMAMDVSKRLADDPDLTKLRQQAAAELGLSALPPLELPGLVGDLRTLSGIAGTAWRVLAKRKGGWAWAFGLAAAIVVSLLVGLVLLIAHGGQWHGWIAIGATVASLAGFTAKIRPVLADVSDGLDAAEKALQQEEKLVQQFNAQQAAERVELEAELELLTAREQSLTAQLVAAAAAVAEAKSEEQDLRAGRRLHKFLEERSGSSDYRSQLGLISLLHKDFRRLDALLGLARGGADNDLPRIDRIILYIDDLDRCPPARVVEVLQAMHLLLALPLFVVVVGVDPRWLLGSLKRHYRALLQTQVPGQARAARAGPSQWASTPQDYLEKIFQIPFALMPMTSTGFEKLVSDLAGEPAAEPRLNGHEETAMANPADRDKPSALGDQPSADEGEPSVPSGSGQASAGTPTSRAVQAEPPAPSGGGNGDSARAVPGADGYEALPEPDALLPGAGDAEPVLPDGPGQLESPAPTPDSGLPARQDDGVRPDEPGPDGLPSALPAAAADPEKQRIIVQAGSVADSDEDRIDPNPAGLGLTRPEIRFIQAMAPMITTPRVGTRLVNIYRMIRSTQATGGNSRFLDRSTGIGDYQAILILLAIVSGFPDLAAPTVEALLQASPDLSWPAFVDELLAREPARGDQGGAHREDWVRMGKGLAAVRAKARVPDGLTAYREWAPQVARFSFAAGHALSGSAASPSATSVPQE